MRARIVVRVALFLSIAVCSQAALAATVTWNRNGGTDYWSNPANWDSGLVPGSGDDVILTKVGSFDTVRIDLWATVNSVTIQNAAVVLIQAGQLLTINSASSVNAGGTLLLNSSNCTGNGSLSVSGTVDIYGGTMDGSGTLTINSGGLVQFWGTANSSRVLRNTTNSGTINFLNTIQPGQHFGFGGATLTNTGVIDIQTDHDVNNDAGTPVLTNNSGGVVKKSAGSGTANINFRVDSNAGSTVRADSGTLTFPSGGTFDNTTIAGAGTVSLPAGHTVSGTTAVSGTLRLTGNATVSGTLNAGGTLYIDTGVDVTWPNVNLTASTSKIDGPGALHVSGTFTWSGGTITGSGTRELTAASTPAIVCDAATCALDGAALALNNSATFSASSHALVLSNAASLAIAAGKTLTMTGDGNISAGTGAASSISSGNFLKSGGTGSSTVGVPVTSSGATLQANSGTLAFTGGGTFPNATIAGAGTVSLPAGAVVSGVTAVSGTLRLTGNATVSGTLNAGGTLYLDTGVDVTWPDVSLTASTSKIDGPGALHVSGSFTWSGGTITGSGTRELTAASTPAFGCAAAACTLDGAALALNNSATFSASSNALVLSNAASLAIATGKTLSISNDGDIAAGTGAASSITNNGRIWKSAGSGISTIGVPVVASAGSSSIIRVESGTLQFGGGATLGANSTALDIRGPGTLEVTGGVFLFNVAAVSLPGSGQFTVSGGTLRVPLNLTITIPSFTLQATGVVDGGGTLVLAGTSTWSGGTMGNAATGGITRIDSGNVLNVTSATAKSLSQNRMLSNNGGTITYSGSSLTLSSGSTVSNSGTFDITADGGVSGSGTISNSGSFGKSAGSGSSTIAAPLQNTGTVTVTSGTLDLSGDGVHTGSFTATAPGTLRFAGGTQQMGGAGSIGGTGMVVFGGATATVGIAINASALQVTAGTVTLNGSTTAGAFAMSGGTLAGSGTATLTNGGSWSGGTMSGSGKTVNPATKTLGVSAPVSLSRTLQNDGTLSVNAIVAGSGTIVNNGTLDAAAASTIFPSVNSSGAITTSAALTLRGGGTYTGSFTITSPGTLQFATGTHSLSGTGSIGGTGTLAFSSATATTVAIPINVAAMSVTGGGATLNATATAGAFTMSAGTIGGSGTLTLTNGGSWSGGGMIGSGTTINSKILTVTAPVSLGRALQNDGTLNVNGDVAGSGTIANNGTLNAAANVVIDAAVNNNAQVTTNATLSLHGNGTHNGTFTANGSGVIDFSGGTQTISGALNGTGSVRFSGATATVNGAWSGMPMAVTGGSVALNTNGSIPALALSGGTLTGSGDVTISGPSSWDGGTIAGSGALTFDSGVTVTMGGAGPATLGRPLRNNGTIAFSAASNGLLINGVTVTNQGTFDVASTQSILAAPGTPAFVNSGTLKKSSGAGAVQFGAPLTNSGVVKVEAGTMQFGGSYAQSSGATNVLAGATLQTATLALNGGALTGNGTIAGQVSNHASVSPGASPGTLTIDGDYVQGVDGSLTIEIAGTAPGTQYDRLLVSGSVTLDGSLNVTHLNGFTPTAGNAFQILTFGSRPNNTTFAVMNGLPYPGTVLAPAFGASDLQLIANRIQADIAAAVAAPPSVPRGSAFAYTVSVFNGGGSDASAVSFTATLPPNVTFTGASPAVCSGAPNLVCTVGPLANQATATVVIQVTANAAGAAPISVLAYAAEFDPSTANNTASASPAVTALADLRVAVTGPASTVAGSQALYSILVTNDGPDTAANVTVSATASPGLAFGANGGACTGSFPCSIASLASGQSATINSAWIIAKSATGSVQLAVNASSATSDPNSANNAAGATTVIGTCPAIVITAPNEMISGATAAASATAVPGATYTWSIDNGKIESDDGIGGISFSAGIPGTTKVGVSVTGGGCSLTATFTVTVKPRPSCQGSATPASPADGTATGDALVAFRWQGVEGASGYRVWLQQGDAPLQDLGTTLGTSLTKAILPGAYRWYVETLFDGCASQESQRLSFTILAASDCAGREAPQLLAPASQSTTSSATLTFSWSAVPRAIQYELWLAPAGGVPTLIRTTTETSHTATVTPAQLDWYVRALFAGCAATESAHRTFVYAPPANCPTRRPLLIAPAEGERLTAPASFAWSAVAGATSYELFVDGRLAATTATPRAAGIAVAPGERRWIVRAHFAQGCAALDSSESRFAVIPPPVSCAPLETPVLAVPAQLSSAVNGRLQWTSVAGATGYVVDISTSPQFTAAATASWLVTDQQMPVTFVNDGSSPSARYIRVHAIDTKCVPAANGPFSLTAALFVLPPSGSEGAALLGEAADVRYTLSIAAEFAGQSFTATPTVPWITVAPQSGIVPSGGGTVIATAHTADLPPGTNIGGVAITIAAASGSHTIGKSVTLSNLPPYLTTPKNTPPPDALIIPAVANVTGIFVRFQSNVHVTNTSAQVMKYELNFVPTGAAGIHDGQKSTLSIEPGATVALESAIGAWFSSAGSSSGTLEIRPVTEIDASTSSEPTGGLAHRVTFVSSRTFSVTPDGGTYGQYVPAIPFTNFVGKGSTLSLQQIAQSDRFRTNLGLVEGSGNAVSLQVRIFDTGGAKLADFPVSLNGGEHSQINGVLAAHGVTLDDGRIEVEVKDGDGSVTAYASVIDNASGDPLLVPPVPIGQAGQSEWVVPGIADLTSGSGNWQSDVRIFNAGSDPADLTLAFYSMKGGDAATKTLTVPPGEVRRLDRVLSVFGIAQDGGALHVTSAAPASLVVTARTYNQTGNGAYGQFIPAVTPEESVAVGSRPLQILEMEESARYRSNVGFAEVSGKPVTLEVSVFRADSSETAKMQLTLGPNEFRQINGFLASLGMSDVYNARISVSAIDGDGRATAYGSLIDMQTQDPTYIPGQ